LINGGLYLDYVNDDARLTIEIIKKAHELGTLMANYVKAIDFIYDKNDHIIGVLAEDTLTQETCNIYVKVVVNATGPWSNKTSSIKNAVETNQSHPAIGIHQVVDEEKLPVKHTIYTDTVLADERMMFINPRGNKTYFRTTDTQDETELIEPPITQEEIDYL